MCLSLTTSGYGLPDGRVHDGLADWPHRGLISVEEPHIIPVFGAGEVDGVLYTATKFVPGGAVARFRPAA